MGRRWINCNGTSHASLETPVFNAIACVHAGGRFFGERDCVGRRTTGYAVTEDGVYAGTRCLTAEVTGPDEFRMVVFPFENVRGAFQVIPLGIRSEHELAGAVASLKRQLQIRRRELNGFRSRPNRDDLG